MPAKIPTETIIAELKRVAGLLKGYMRREDFNRHARFGASVVEQRFGTWRAGLRAAGLEAPDRKELALRRGKSITDEALLQDIIRLTKEFGRRPTNALVSSAGRYSTGPYRERWGNLHKACQAAYQMFGWPLNSQPPIGDLSVAPPQRFAAGSIDAAGEQHEDARNGSRTYGERLAFRGIEYAPVNEADVRSVFAAALVDLGFTLYSNRVKHCDAEAMYQNIDGTHKRVFIEFEFESQNFQRHGHDPQFIDMIVCWRHNWPECPLRVLELRQVIKSLTRKAVTDRTREAVVTLPR